MSLVLSTRHQRFAHARLPGPHLTHSGCALSATLTTPALDRRSLRWFETSPCRAISGGPPPSPVQHRLANNDPLHRHLPFVRGTRRHRRVAVRLAPSVGARAAVPSGRRADTTPP